MIYNYDEGIVNRSNEFFDDKNFVGYILPDGSIYKCKDHNVINIETFLQMYLNILDYEYEKRDELFSVDTKDKLGKVVFNKLRQMSHDEIHALKEFIDGNNIILSDLLVNFFGCHLITRLKKEIVTSEINHQCFYNYLLHDFKIKTIDKIMYNEENKTYQYVKANPRNDYLYDEIDKLKKEVNEEEIELFHKIR